MQSDRDSLPMQRSDLTKYAELMLHTTDYVIFEDAGFSGKNTDRPAYQRMIARIRAGEFTHLLVWKIDRISRNLLDFADLFQELKRLKVTFVSYNEQFDTSSAMGEAMLKIILVFAELERNITSERVSAVMLSRAAEGKYNGSGLPYGYTYDRENGRFEVNPAEAQLVRLIYATYIDTHSLAETAALLNTKQVPTRSGALWSSPVISHILHNPVYIGKIRYQSKNTEIVTDATHAAIITEQDFNTVQSIFDTNTGTRVNAHTKYVHPFGGLVYCTCGAQMTVNTTRLYKSGNRYTVFLCPVCRHKSKSIRHTSDSTFGTTVFQLLFNLIAAYNDFTPRTSLYDLERRIHRGIAKYRVQYDDICRLHKTLSEHGFEPSYFSADDISTAPTEISQTIAKKSAALDRLNTVYIAGQITLEQYQAKSAQLAADLEMLRAADTSALPFDLPSLIRQRSVKYDVLLQKYGPAVLRRFLYISVSRITLDGGSLSNIQVKNGFIYNFSSI